MGVPRSSGRLPPRAALVRAMRLSVPVAILPEGITRLARVTAATASSGEMPDCSSLSGVRGRRGNTGQGSEQGAHAVEREILHFALGSGGAAENQLADSHAARVETRDEGRHGSGRHEGAGTVDIADGFAHRRPLPRFPELVADLRASWLFPGQNGTSSSVTVVRTRRFLRFGRRPPPMSSSSACITTSGPISSI